MFLEISQNSQENTYARVPEACNFVKKETLAQVFSCEFCEISKNIFSHRTPLVAASVLLISRFQNKAKILLLKLSKLILLFDFILNTLFPNLSGSIFLLRSSNWTFITRFLCVHKSTWYENKITEHLACIQTIIIQM